LDSESTKEKVELSLIFTLDMVKERIHRITKDKKRMLILCILVTLLSVGIASAYVYNSMLVKSTIVVGN
jgi:hypothetical protein